MVFGGVSGLLIIKLPSDHSVSGILLKLFKNSSNFFPEIQKWTSFRNNRTMWNTFCDGQ